MRRALLLLLLVMAAAPAAAQSCATLGGTLDCRGAATKPAANSPRPSRPRQDVEVHGQAETTVSNRGASTTMENRVIDSHGSMEIGISGSIGTPCRRRGYGCD
jgi:hypothetical protein